MRRFWIWIGAGMATLIVAVIVAAFFMDEPLRRLAERELNKRVSGYSFRIGKLDFHSIPLSLDIENITVVQDANPEPPMATVAKWHGSIEFKPLFFGRFVSTHEIEKPILHITYAQAKKENEDAVSFKDRGWQQIVRDIPFKINSIEVVDGGLTYVDEANPSRPVKLTNLKVRAANIENVQSKDREYPSEFSIDGVLFDAGRLKVEGRADFLAEPHVGVKGTFHLEKTPLGPLLPVTNRVNLELRQGTIEGEGEVEYAPSIKEVDVKNLTVEGLQADYVHKAATKAGEQQRAKETAQAAEKLNKQQELIVRVEKVRLLNCELGFVNEAIDPDYRIFLAHTDLTLDNYSNHFKEGTAVLKMKGKFMDAGNVLVKGNFRAEQTSPDFDLDVEIGQTQMKAMNDLWRAHGSFDVTKGLFSFYSELAIKDGAIKGYFKPVFKDVKVYDPHQDRHKGVLQKVYEGVAGGLIRMLKNAPRDEVATKAEISGKLDSPNTDTAQAVLRLIQNAFFDAILPGLERQVGRG